MRLLKLFKRGKRGKEKEPDAGSQEYNILMEEMQRVVLQLALQY